MIPAPVQSVPQTDRWCLRLMPVCDGTVTGFNPLVSRLLRGPEVETGPGRVMRDPRMLLDSRL